MHGHLNHGPAPFEAPIVRLDGVEIPQAEIAAEMQHHPAPDGGSAWHAAAEALVLRRMLLGEAARQGIDATPEGDETSEDAQVRRLLDVELRVPEADEATCRRWYDANRARFRTSPLWRVVHLLIAADPADTPAREAARASAEVALAEVKADPSRLAELARAGSDCPSREQGGDLGLVTRGTTVAEFEAALIRTPAGAVHSGVIETRYGFHVVRVLDRAEGRQVPFEEARPRIAEWLREAAWRRAAHQYLALLASRAEIEGIAVSARVDGPLVQ
jgi:peptidyl-prolyl cis-trans isomerase C